MKRLRNKIRAWLCRKIGLHSYYIVDDFHRYYSKLACKDCNGEWFADDINMTLYPWSDECEKKLKRLKGNHDLL